MIVVETPRLQIRRLDTDDAGFIVRLFNDPAFLKYVGDKGVRSVEDARQYILTGPMASYERHGFGHYLVALKETMEPIGICSLVKREWLADVDLGFAFLPGFRHAGYGFESAAAVLGYARDTLKLPRIVAITSLDNEASIGLLGKLGFRFEGTTRVPGDLADVRLFASAR